MDHFPLEAWAMRNPRVRFPLLLALVLALSWLGSFA